MPKETTFHFKNVLSYYWRHIRPYRFSFVFIYIFYFIAILASNVFAPLIYKNIIDTTAEIVHRSEAYHQLMILFLWLVVNNATFNLFYRLGDYTIVFTQSRILKDLSNEVFERVTRHGLHFFSNQFTGALVAKAKRYIASFETLHDRFTYNIFFGFIKVVSYMIVLYLFTPLIALLYLIWLILYIIIVRYFVNKQVPYDLAEATADSATTARFSDVVSNILNLKIFSQKAFEYTSYQKITAQQEKKRRAAWNYHNFQNLIQGILFMMLELGVMYFTLSQWLAGQISTGTIVLVHIYIIGSFDIVWTLGKAIIQIQKALTDAQEMITIFEEDLDVNDPPHPHKANITKGEIIFDHVCFSYVNGQTVFDDFSLQIAPGEKIGLVGHSGAGKTTLVKLLLRFADVTSGKITIDGQNIAHIKQDDLRQRIAYVPQDPLLFHRSLRENIAYSKPNATMEEIITAAKKAQAHDFITALPHGYDTLVGERGIKLSGGERQRVAIARALLKDAPIVILDEATSALDSISEKYIQKAFEELMKNRTTIVIAHRLSTIQKMDRIIVLDHGTIKESGTHATLIKNPSGIYATFWKSQAGEFLRE